MKVLSRLILMSILASGTMLYTGCQNPEGNNESQDKQQDSKETANNANKQKQDDIDITPELLEKYAEVISILKKKDLNMYGAVDSVIKANGMTATEYHEIRGMPESPERTKKFGAEKVKKHYEITRAITDFQASKFRSNIEIIKAHGFTEDMYKKLAGIVVRDPQLTLEVEKILRAKEKEAK